MIPHIRTLFVLLLVALSSCAAASLREAQDAFNAGSAQEAEIRANGLEFQTGLTGHVEALLEYRAALSELDEQIDSHADELRKDELLGTAYLLKALCLWRIIDLTGLEGDPSEGAGKALTDVLGRIKTEYSSEKIVLGTRDRVLARALPGLRDHDRGLRAATLKGTKGAETYFSSAMSSYENALTTPDLPSNHPIRLYVQLAQLSTLNAWQAAALTSLPEDEHLGYLKARVREPARKIAEKLLTIAEDSNNTDLTNHVNVLKGRLGI